MIIVNENDEEIEIETPVKGVYNDFIYELNTKPNECYSDYQAVLLITNDEIINLIYKYQMPHSEFGSQEIWGTDEYYGDLYIDSHYIAVPIFDLHKEMESFETIYEFIEYTIDAVIDLDPDNFFYELNGYEVEKRTNVETGDSYIITFTLSKLNNKLGEYLGANTSFDMYAQNEEELKINQFSMLVLKESDVDECIEEIKELINNYKEE